MKKLFLALMFSASIGCATAKTDMKADWDAIVKCAKIDPANVAVKVAAENCIISSVDGQYAQCLLDFMPLASWSESEIACVAAATIPPQLTPVK